MGQGRAQIYNLISLLFIVLTIAALVLIGARMAAPLPVPTQSAAIPTSAILPSPTMTYTFTPTHTPTRTETSVPPTATDIPTITPTLTWTIIPTLAVSLTPTPFNTEASPLTDGQLPTVEGAATATNTLTPTPEPTSTPALQYELRDEQVIYTGNFANAAGCAWQGVGGQVVDADDQPLLDVRVHVFGTDVDVFTTSGSNTLYGLSGWEVPLGTTLTSNSYLVELQSADGAIVSPQITLSFTPDCAKNLALVSFQQIS